MLASSNHRDNIILFAFRKSQRVFFEKIIESCQTKKIKIVSTKSSWSISLQAFGKFKYVNTDGACDFAIDEFYAKTNLSIPRIILKMYFKTFAYINFLRYYGRQRKKEARGSFVRGTYSPYCYKTLRD